VDTLARNAWGEARGCGALGMQRVINVMINRADNPRWWGHDVTSVCLAPWQFSCRNESDPNLPKLLAVTDEDPQFRIATSLATKAVARQLPDLTFGADSYYAIGSPPPEWAKGKTPTVSDGWHHFYRLEL
jgi:spore germination cell wall hydrolase CwlJ-like protein